jgi:hypothetical protein
MSAYSNFPDQVNAQRTSDMSPARRGGRWRMPCFLTVAALALAAVLGSGLARAFSSSNVAVTPVYTVAQIHGLLRYHPASALGHTVQVRGILEGPFVFCGDSRPCPPATWGLVDTETQSTGPDQYLPVVARRSGGLWEVLHNVPVLQTLIPAPQRLQFGIMATYRLQLRAAPVLCNRNPAVLCSEGLVPDAAPSALASPAVIYDKG